MKKLLIFLVMIPVIGFSQAKTVLNASRYFVKPDKIRAFEKAIGEHAKKYHTGDWSWRVWSIESGPDAGGYMVTEGPGNWESIDKRGDLGAAHMDDWHNSIAPLLSERYSNMYADFRADLSTVELTDYADKIIINYYITKPGKIGAVADLIQKMKKIWNEGNESVAVYSMVASGDPTFITVSRLKNGLKELASDYRKPLDERFKAAHGNDDWQGFLKDFADGVERRWSELLVYKPELSSK